MNHFGRIRSVLRVLCTVIAVSVGEAAQSATPVLKPQLLASVPYSAADSTRLLSLWEVPWPADRDAFRLKTGLKGQITGIEIAPNVAFLLVDGALESPFSGNLLWVLKATESILPRDMTILSGSIT